MSPERPISPEQMLGKTIADILPLLPDFPWYVSVRGQKWRPPIQSFVFVAYETKPSGVPKTEGDSFFHLCPGDLKDINKLTEFLKRSSSVNKRTLGISSKILFPEVLIVGKEVPEWVKPLPSGAHIPMIDMDIRSPCPEKELIQLFIEKLKESTELEHGLIFSSGNAGHYHFIGTDRLFTDNQFDIFLFSVLGMKDLSGNFFVDQAWVKYSGVPQASMIEEFKKKSSSLISSIYDFERNRYATLRVTTNPLKPKLPVVIKIF